MKKPFLKFLAEQYASCPDLCEYCFVFPNRRAGKFFAKELGEVLTSTILTPEITTIDGFVTDLTDAIEANRIESLVILFNAYKQLDPDSPTTFDRFAHWGDVILNDFGDIDRYMVDARQAFFNISELKEIKSNYLTKEVKEVLSHFFNMRFAPNDEEHFWQHISTNNGEVEIKKDFISIWHLLWPLYNKFIDELNAQHLTYNGKKYRDAATKARAMHPGEFEFKRYVFAGFNMLSVSEHELFKAMKTKGIADFYWDYNSPCFGTPTNKATRFMSEYVREFPQPNTEPRNESMPQNIYAAGVPSNYAQARYAASIIKNLVDRGMTNRQDAIDTAIVLPDESLFMPVLKSIGTDVVDKINITMGLSIRHSSISSLMSLIARMHFQAKSVNGVWSYFHADVKDVLLHPLVKFFNHDEATTLINHINWHNSYQVTFDTIAEFAPNLAPLFTVVKDLTLSEIEQYITTILDFTRKVYEQKLQLKKGTNTTSSDNNDSDISTSTVNVEQAFLNSYYDALSQLHDALTNFNVLGSSEKVDINTFCFLLDRLVAGTKVAFEGEPLGGLQVMGILETRCLDFKNLVIMSMNERVFPRKHFTKSFIPQRLRRAFGMSTIEHQESMYAYYFYRMISRAENVFLLYDSRTQSLGSGEKSRFISQLDTLFNHYCRVNTVFPKLEITAPNKNPIVVRKDERIMQLINAFATQAPVNDAPAYQESKIKYLSAHSINTYIDCPLRFYLRYVEGLAEIDPVSEFMEASTFGTIVHNTIQQLYPDGTTIDEAFIDNLLKQTNSTIHDAIIANINHIFLHKPEGCLDELIGESMLKYDVIYEFIRRILNHDKELIKEYGNINYIQGEKRLECSLPLAGGKQFNLTFTIDRLDSITINGHAVYRVVDYKTGKDKVGTNNLTSLFNPNATDRPHAILQLMLYCKALAQDPEYCDKTLMPVIYSLLEINSSGMSIDKKQITYPDTDPDGVNSQFYNQLQDVLLELFDPSQPFRQTTNEDNCKYCKFKDFCHRE